MYSKLLMLAFILMPIHALAKLPIYLPQTTIAESAVASVNLSSSYYSATVNFYDGPKGMRVYIATLTQPAPIMSLPELKFGGIILKGGKLTMALPSPSRPGTVTLTGTYTTTSNATPVPVNVVLGSWKLNQ